MKIQVTGLPASGKTTAIHKYLDSVSFGQIEHQDLADFSYASSPFKEILFRLDLANASHNTIAESACGVFVSGTKVVRLVIPIREVYCRLHHRGDPVDEDYLSLLESMMVPADHIVYSEEELIFLLEELFRSNDATRIGRNKNGS